MMDAKQAALFEKITAFEFDRGPTSLTFADRLAKENGWRIAYAERVIAEYKRFLFLAMAAGHPASPSDAVDQAWHLHLVYTRSYWDDLCRDVLGRPLHHGPTLGGAAEQEKHNDWYERTLASYRRMFDAEPPHDIWPPLAQWQQTRTRFERVDRERYWLLPKVRLPRLGAKGHVGALGLVALPLAITLNPLDWQGPLFLLFFIIMFAVAVAIGIAIRLWTDETAQLNDKELALDAGELAFLNGGQRQMTQAVLAGMIHQGTIELRREGKTWLSPGELTLFATKNLPSDAGHLAQLIHREASGKSGLKISGLPAVVSPHAERVKQSLEDRELLSTGTWHFLAALPMLALLLFGVLKIGVGLWRDKPVVFLVIGCVAALIAAGLLMRASRLSGKGRRLVSLWKEKHADLDDGSTNANLSPSDMMLSVAMFGLATTATPPLGQLRDALGPGNTSASCGSSCGGGGGGCGGGGCGGCGGGGD